MARHLAISLLVLGVLQGYALAQFNILPVSVAESVIEGKEMMTTSPKRQSSRGGLGN